MAVKLSVLLREVLLEKCKRWTLVEHTPFVDFMGCDDAGVLSVFVVCDSGTPEAERSNNAQPVVDTSVAESAQVDLTLSCL